MDNWILITWAWYMDPIAIFNLFIDWNCKKIRFLLIYLSFVWRGTSSGCFCLPVPSIQPSNLHFLILAVFYDGLNFSALGSSSQRTLFQVSCIIDELVPSGFLESFLPCQLFLWFSYGQRISSIGVKLLPVCLFQVVLLDGILELKFIFLLCFIVAGISQKLLTYSFITWMLVLS